jgi:hypothetical protein
MFEKGVTVHDRHGQIHDDRLDPVPVGLQGLQPGKSVVGLQDFVVEIRQMGAEGTADGGFIATSRMAMS